MRLFCAWRKISCQPHGLHHAAADEIRKHVPRPDRRQLVRVADEKQAAAGLQRLQERRHQRQVDHRRLVHDHRVAAERRILIVIKGHRARLLVKLRLEKPVDGRGLTSRDLREPLGGPAGRRSELRFELQLVEQLQNARHDRRLARAGPAGHDQQLLRSRRSDGVQAARARSRCSCRSSIVFSSASSRFGSGSSASAMLRMRRQTYVSASYSSGR